MPETRSQTAQQAKMRSEIKRRLGGKAISTQKTDATQNVDAADGFSKLFELPSEIRNMIYGYATAADPDEVIFLENLATPALARVCRKLRNEVLHIYLRINTFHIAVESVSATDNNPKDIAFKIRQSTLNWLNQLGKQAPLFTHLFIHFKGDHDTEVCFKSRGRDGFSLTHEMCCRFCHALPDAPPAVPASIINSMPNSALLNRIIDLNEERLQDVVREHTTIITDLAADIFAGSVNQKAKALSMEDLESIERSLALGRSTFALALHTINMKRLKETPLLIKVNDVQYQLRRGVS